MREVFWFGLGGFIGFDLGLGYAVVVARRFRRGSHVADRIRPYVGQRGWPW